MKLFCPGPVMISNRVRKSMVDNCIGHREPNFEKLFNDLKRNILTISNADSSYEALVLSASGSAINEAVVSSIFNTNDKILIVSNGVFGERVASMMDIYKLNYTVYSKNIGETINLEELENILKEGLHNYLFITHHETSCGMINPIKEIGDLCKKYNVKFFVDCVSSFGGEEVDVVKQNIDIMTSVSGKCVGATPGASFVVIKRAIVKETKNNQPRSSYLHLHNYYNYSKQYSQTPNTPSVNTFFALNTALEEIIESNKSENYILCSKFIRDKIEEIGFEFVIDRSLMSNTVTTFCVPKTIGVNKMYERLLEAKFVTYLTKGEMLEAGGLQIAIMGNVTIDDCKLLIDEIKAIA